MPRRDQDALPPGIAVQRQQDAIPGFHGLHVWTEGQNATDAFITDDRWQRRRVMKLTFDE
jgi:hypothetical protein